METNSNEALFLNRVSSATIRVVLLGGWIAWCLQIVLPFIVPVVWGAIIATAVSPLIDRLFRQRRSLGATLFGITAFAVILVPSYLFFDSIVEFVFRVGRQWSHGEFKVPEPRANVAEWPLVGKRLYAGWTSLANTPEATIEAHLPQLRGAGRWLLQSLGGLTVGILQSLFAVAAAAVFLAKSEPSHRGLLLIVDRIAPSHGQRLVELATGTVRSVAKGVLGVAAIQATLAWFGFYFAGVPAPGVWALLVLICAVAQLPTLLVLGPLVAYVFASSSPQAAIAFTIWCIFIGVIDNVLKPLLLGRGAGAPTLVIVVGALGGMFTSGIIGLFVGSVVLAVGYALAAAWITRGDTLGEPEETVTIPELS